MARYVFIESRDPFESRDSRFVTDTAAALKGSGNEVTVFLVQNGVLASRRTARNKGFASLAAIGIKLLADDFSLRERGIATSELAPGVREASIDSLVDRLLEDGTKAVWH